jgi:hypothetical protein
MSGLLVARGDGEDGVPMPAAVGGAVDPEDARLG